MPLTPRNRWVRRGPVLATAIAIALAALSAPVLANASDDAVGPFPDFTPDQSTIDRANVTLATVDTSAVPRIVDDDTALLEATESEPQFGGIWSDDTADGIVVSIAVVPGSQGERAVAENVRRLLQANAKQQASPFSAELASATSHIQAVAARYTFTQLKDWQDSIDRVMPAGLVTLSDADERANTVTLGVASESDRATVEKAALAAGIPSDALKVVVANLSTALLDDHRPLAGGQQIQFLKPIFGDIGIIGFNQYSCSLGVIATIVNTSPNVNGYLTNSHCSIDYASVDYVYHWQPSIPFGSLFNTTNRIGFEVLDPPLFTGNPYGTTSLTCPSGDQCRASDAAFGQLDGNDYPSTPRGSIARPSTTGTTSWNGTDRYRITSTSTPSGAVRAVGRTSGMSVGTILASCVRVGVADYTNVSQLCSYIGSYSSDHGDSGGPVFRVTNSPSTNDVSFVGLNWGGGTYDGSAVGVLSSWSMIQLEQQPYSLRVCASGFTC